MRGDLKKISFLSLSWKGRQPNTGCVIFRGWCGGLPGGKAFYNLGCVFCCCFGAVIYLFLSFCCCFVFFQICFLCPFSFSLKKCLQGLYSSLATDGFATGSPLAGSHTSGWNGLGQNKHRL